MVKIVLYPASAELNLPEADRPEAVSVDKWLSPLSEPVRRTKGALLAVALIASGVAYVGEPIAPEEEVTVDSWFQALSEPVRVSAPLPVAAKQFASNDADLLTQPEQTFVSKWYTPLSEPLFVKPRVVEFQAFATPHLDPAPDEVVTVDKWYRELSEPVRTKKPLPVGAYQHFSVDADLLTQPEAVLLKWYQPLSEPVRTQKPLPIATYKFFAQNELPIPPPVPTPGIEGWFRPLEEPPAFKIAARLIEALQVSFTHDPVTPKNQWGPEFPIASVWSEETLVSGSWNEEAVPGGGGWSKENPPC